jgi:hypothetical protein
VIQVAVFQPNTGSVQSRDRKGAGIAMAVSRSLTVAALKTASIRWTEVPSSYDMMPRERS